MLTIQMYSAITMDMIIITTKADAEVMVVEIMDVTNLEKRAYDSPFFDAEICVWGIELHP